MNRHNKVLENSFVWAWPAEQNQISVLEAHLFHDFNAKSPLVNGSVPPKPASLGFELPAVTRVQVMEDDEIQARRAPALRFPRQIQHFNQLVDYILNTQDKPHLRRALEVYFTRLTRYYREFLGSNSEIAADSGQQRGQEP